jgi:dynein heavy chain
VKKSILNYVLKDDEEKMRVGIMQIFDEILDYGSNIFLGIEPADEWRVFYFYLNFRNT